MKLDFVVAGLIVNMFFMWMPISGMQLPPSRTFVHERKVSLQNIGKPTNKWVEIISQIPKEEESKKIDLLRLLEWDAYHNAKADLKIYEQALSDLKQKKF